MNNSHIKNIIKELNFVILDCIIIQSLRIQFFGEKKNKFYLNLM
jgi:hypothetical protein